MYLIKINMIGPEISETGLDIRCHCFSRPCHGLGCQNKLIPDSLQAVTDILFTDRISSGRINIIDPAAHHIL